MPRHPVIKSCFHNFSLIKNVIALSKLRAQIGAKILIRTAAFKDQPNKTGVIKAISASFYHPEPDNPKSALY